LDTERFRNAIAAIDAANAEDPNTIRVRGLERQKELAHAELVSEWVRRLRPQASEALLLAARAHHIRRWTVPRSSYPDGRGGYLRWRRDLHEMHATETANILRAHGYDQETIDRVARIVRKENLAGDLDVQALEDALCLVFLETQLHDLARQLDEDRMADVLQKTWRKMSDEGKRLALGIAVDDADRALLKRALAELRSAIFATTP
jgi:hypothetical protein